jgi:hypothetical protein
VCPCTTAPDVTVPGARGAASRMTRTPSPSSTSPDKSQPGQISRTPYPGVRVHAPGWLNPKPDACWWSTTSWTRSSSAATPGPVLRRARTWTPSRRRGCTTHAHEGHRPQPVRSGAVIYETNYRAGLRILTGRADCARSASSTCGRRTTRPASTGTWNNYRSSRSGVHRVVGSNRVCSLVKHLTGTGPGIERFSVALRRQRDAARRGVDPPSVGPALHRPPDGGHRAGRAVPRARPARRSVAERRPRPPGRVDARQTQPRRDRATRSGLRRGSRRGAARPDVVLGDRPRLRRTSMRSSEAGVAGRTTRGTGATAGSSRTGMASSVISITDPATARGPFSRRANARRSGTLYATW